MIGKCMENVTEGQQGEGCLTGKVGCNRLTADTIYAQLQNNGEVINYFQVATHKSKRLRKRMSSQYHLSFQYKMKEKCNYSPIGLDCKRRVAQRESFNVLFRSVWVDKVQGDSNH